MKVSAVAAVVSVFANAEHFMQRAPAPGPAGPAPGPAPGPQGPTIEEQAHSTLGGFMKEVAEHFEEEAKEYTKPTPVILGWEVEFEIENYNYFDLNKPLEVVTEDPTPAPPAAPKLAKPEAKKKDPGFWTRPAVDMGFGKTGKQMRNFPGSLGDASRSGLYPVDLTDGSPGEDLKSGPMKGKTETKDVVEKKPKQEKTEPEKPAPTAKPAAPEKSGKSDGVAGGWDATVGQFNDLVGGNTPGHGKDGNWYPVNLGLLQTENRANSATGRCLTQQGMFADTCVVDVLRTAVKTSFVDLVETVLDTPEERKDLLKWFMANQHQEAQESEEAEAERIAEEAERKADIMQQKAASAKAAEAHAKDIQDEAAERTEQIAAQSAEAEQAAIAAKEEAEQAKAASAEAEQHQAAMDQQHQTAESAVGEFVQVSQHEFARSLMARRAAAPGPAPGPAPGVPVLEESVQDKVAPMGAPGPAPGPASVDTAMQPKEGAIEASEPVLQIQSSLAPGPAPPAGALRWKVDTFVQFYPGEERPVVEDGNVGRSTKVKVWIRGEANTGIFELAPWIQGVLTRHEKDGLLEYLLEKRLKDATDIAPTIQGIKDIRLDSKSQWSLDTCAAHMKKIMKEFSEAYTRRMVPTAIYNECTNFVSEVSFSHDRLFDSHDRMKCRHATVKLAKEWNFGKGHKPALDGPAGPAPAPGPAAPAPGATIDYAGFCAEVCEIKYGSDAPMCHVTEGKKLFSAAP